MLQKYLIKVALTLLLEWLHNHNKSDDEMALYISDNTSLTPGTVNNLMRLLVLGDDAVIKAGR